MLIPAVVFLVLYAPALWIAAAVFVITLLSLLEYNNLTQAKQGENRQSLPGIFFGLSVPAVFYIFGEAAAPPVIVAAVFVFFLSGIFFGADLKKAFTDVAFRALGVVYIALPLSYLILLSNVKGGRWWIIFFLTVIWFNDSFAFLTGKLIGRHRLSPVISPGKSVEGLFGGIAFGMIAAALFNYFFQLDHGYAKVLLFSVVIAVVGVLGDLTESFIKRGAGVKDSGTIVPGHGGILDRIDSIIFAAPVLYYLLVFFCMV